MSNILKPGTGTNYYYAKKHGEPIRNVVDAIGLTLSDDYSPTYSSNSIDALETLCKVAPEDRPRSSLEREAPPEKVVEPPSQQQPKKNYETTMDYGSTFGFVGQIQSEQPAVAPTSQVPKTITLSHQDMELALGPANGWTAEDARCQIDALRHCQNANPTDPIREGFNKSVDLSNSSFAKSGWATGVLLATVAGGGIALATAPLWAPALVAVGGGLAVKHLMKSANRDSNDSAILGDMSMRLDRTLHNMTEERHGTHGNYRADFSGSR